MDIIFYGILDLFGWYIFIVGGIILIIVGFYFGLYFLIIIGVILLSDGIIGLVFEKKYGKKLGGGLAGSILLLSLGVITFVFYFSWFMNEVLLIIGLSFLLLGAIFIPISIRKYKKEQLKQEKLKGLIEEKKKAYQERIGETLQAEEKVYLKSIEDIIFEYLEENRGKAFTANSIHKRSEELQDLDVLDIKKVLTNLTVMGKIVSQGKEDEIFYHAL